MATIFRTASIWLQIATLCMALGLILFIIGFSTNAWMVRRDRYHNAMDSGLWKTRNCNQQNCWDGDIKANDYHRAIQAMECLGLIGFILAIATLLLYMMLDSCRRRRFLHATTAFTFAGLGFAVIGFAIYGSSTNTENHWGYGGDIGWSMGVACAGGAFYGLAGIALIIQLIK